MGVSDFNLNWFRDKVQNDLKNYALQVSLVDNHFGARKAINTPILFPSDINEENRNTIWKFLFALYPENIPNQADFHNWYNVAWEGFSRITVSELTKRISQNQNVNNLSLALKKTKAETLKWLDEVISFVNSKEPNLLNEEATKILPNQSQVGTFFRKEYLWLDNDTIDEVLKDILAKIAKLTNKTTDWRDEMLDKSIYPANLNFPHDRVHHIQQIGTTISEIVKEMLKNDSPTNEFRDLFSDLLNWLSDNTQKANEYFKSLRTESLLYRTANEQKIKLVTDILQRDRNGDLPLEKLNNPNLALIIELGEQVFADMQKEKTDFEFRKSVGNIFETLFNNLMNVDNRFNVQKVDGEQDFIITNKLTNKRFYVEMKSIRENDTKIQMTPNQAKKANTYPNNYFLCVVVNNGGHIDGNYFTNKAKFDNEIGNKLRNKVLTAQAFEIPENGIEIEFEDNFLYSFSKYRYKFNVSRQILGGLNFDTFKNLLTN